MNSGYAGGGSPSRTLSTMSLTVGPARCINSRSITRSQSFTGVNTSTRPYRSVTALNTPGLCRKPSRASRMFTMSNKSNPPPKVPQPERLDEVYKALRTGLQSYLQVHQIELENLSRQMKESKRNSRLGFLYELDKQVKMTERFIRRLEFHLSKMEELYEAYCLQRRLRDGANKMVKAFTNSLSSKEARESLAEANKGYKEYTENMCMLENELENQLGEFHIKMKGLAGFARLCAGDQYEIFMKYGRQRWKLRGRIEINAKQVWDSEEMVFLPLINDFLSVKVTELKSLANHVVVGSVSCEAKDLFAALPQTVAVDINDLGTIKLSLQVTWSPFDMDDQGSVAGTVNKAPTVSKRLLILNHHLSPPDTPSLREQAFYSLRLGLSRRQQWPLLDVFRDPLSQNSCCSSKSPARQPTANMLQSQDELENGAAWSHSSESSDESSGAELSAEALRNTADDSALTPELLPHSAGTSSSQPDVSFCPRDSAASTPNSTHKGSGDLKASADSNRENLDEASTGHEQEHAGTVHVVNSSHSYSRSLSHISESSADGTVSTDRDAGIMEEGIPLTCVNGIETESPSVAVEPPSLVAADGDVSLRRPEVIEEHSDAPEVTHEQQDGFSLCSLTTETVDRDAPTQPQANAESESTDVTYVARRVSVEEEPSEDQLVDSGLDEALEGVVSSLDDYRGQFPELQLLEQELKLLQVTLKGGRHSRSSSVVSLTVETALGSFDFLNTSDWEEEDEDEPENRKRTVRSLQDRRCDSPTSPSSHLTTGCTTLDSTLVAHLKNCSAQLLHLGTFGPLRCGEMYALDRLLREARVLEMIRHTATVNPRRLRQPAEVTPQLSLCVGAVSLWQQCVGQGSVYSSPVEVFLLTLSTVYSSMLPDKARNMADTVFSCLTERLLGQRLLRRGGNRDTRMVTLFQLWSYLEANAITDMDTHITELAEEVWLVQNLTSCDQDVIVQTLRRPPECSLRREGVHAVAKLLKDPRGKVSASASSVLRGLATQPRHREQALVSCLELLEDENTDTRVCGCKALACLKAKESINQLVYLCRTDNEEVRDAAKQVLLVLGEEGKMAHRHIEMCMDGIPRLFAPGSMASTAF